MSSLRVKLVLDIAVRSKALPSRVYDWRPARDSLSEREPTKGGLEARGTQENPPHSPFPKELAPDWIRGDPGGFETLTEGLLYVRAFSQRDIEPLPSVLTAPCASVLN